MNHRLVAAGVFLAAAVVIKVYSMTCAPIRPPEIVKGTECAACGMPIEDLRFACTRRDPAAGRSSWRAYDSIECLGRDWKPDGAVRDVHAADYDQSRLHRADSLWVVKGNFPSPMGGGLAAFLERDAALAVADATHGRVMPFDSLLSVAGDAHR